jgi:hypothetical protein
MISADTVFEVLNGLRSNLLLEGLQLSKHCNQIFEVVNILNKYLYIQEKCYPGTGYVSVIIDINYNPRTSGQLITYVLICKLLSYSSF